MTMSLLAAALLTQAIPAGEVPLAAVAGAARYRLSASSDLLLEGLDGRSRAVLADALRVDRDRPAGLLWAHLMTGAMQVRREAAGSADTLWFNPVLDAGLVVRWMRDGDGWVAIAAAPVLGETLRGESGGPATAPAWAGRMGNMAEALKAAAARSFAVADSGSWNRLFEAAPADELAVFARALLARRALRELEATPGYGQSLRLLDRLLVTDDPARRGLPPAMQEALARFGEAGRLTLRPVTALRRPDGWTVVLQSPDAPAIAWFVHFADPAPGRPALPAAFAAVSVNDLEGVRP